METNPEPILDTQVGDAMELARFCRIAEKIEADPTLLQVALDNVDRWLAAGHWARRNLGDWRARLLRAQESNDAFQELLALLRRDDEPARHMKGFSPFAGILTREERDQMRCIYRH